MANIELSHNINPDAFCLASKEGYADKTYNIPREKLGMVLIGVQKLQEIGMNINVHGFFYPDTDITDQSQPIVIFLRSSESTHYSFFERFIYASEARLQDENIQDVDRIMNDVLISLDSQALD